MRPHHHYHLSLPLCTRAHQIGALVLVAVTFILTRSLDRLSSFSSSTSSLYSSSHFSSDQFHAGALNWPERGYGSDIKLRIYVYDESKIDGLQELMRGRDGQITPRPASRDNGALRTTKKDEADFLFVPSYVKCVRTLNDKEVLSQMPYFRGSGGRDHIFIFPSGVGPHLFRSWATYLNRSIILTPEVYSPFQKKKKEHRDLTLFLATPLRDVNPRPKPDLPWRSLSQDENYCLTIVYRCLTRRELLFTIMSMVGYLLGLGA